MPTKVFGQDFPAATLPLDGTESLSILQDGVMVDATTQDIADLNSGGTPGGADTQVQFNDGGSFGGDAGLVYNKTTDTLTTVNLLSTTHTLTGLLLTVASASGSAGFRLPHGAAPSSPTNGDVWTTTAGMFVRINGATVGPIGAGGGLTNWTDGVNTAIPNATVPVVSFTATNAATNVDAAITPKGAGALTAQVADNTTTGGNKRGNRALDLQMERSANSQVASGAYAVALGRNCTASSSGSIAIGQTCAATGTNAVSLGVSNTAAGAADVVAGTGNSSGSGGGSVALGATNTVNNGGVAIGSGCTAQTAYATALGRQTTADAQGAMATGHSAITRGVVGQKAHGRVAFSAFGDIQSAELVVGVQTTNNTQTTLCSDANAAAATNQMVLPNNSAYMVTGVAVAREASTGEAKFWKFEVSIRRGANAAATALVGSATVTVFNETGPGGNTAAWTLAVDADTTNGALRIRGTGENSKTIKWAAAIKDCIQLVG